MANIGKLSVELSAEISKFKSSLKEAEASATGFKDRVSTSLREASDSLGGLAGIAAIAGGALAVAGTQFMAAVNALDKLNDIADATGSSIENISKLENIALKTGASIDVVEQALVKMVTQLKNTDGTDDVSQALDQIGLSYKELKALDPAEAFQKIAVALNEFADDTNKAQLVNTLFSKSFKELAPFLKDTAENLDTVGTATAEQAEKASVLVKQQSALTASVTAYKRELAIELLPTLNDLLKAFVSTDDTVKTSGSNFQWIATLLKGVVYVANDVAYVINQVGKEIGAVGAQAAQVAQGNFKAAAFIGDERTRQAENDREAQDKKQKAILDSGNTPPTANTASNSPAKAIETPKPSVGPQRKVSAPKKASNGNTRKAEPVDPELEMQRDAYKEWASWLSDAEKQAIKLSIATDGLTDSEIKLREIHKSAEYKKLTPDVQALIDAKIQANIETEKAQEQEQAYKDALTQMDKESMRLIATLAELRGAKQELNLTTFKGTEEQNAEVEARKSEVRSLQDQIDAQKELTRAKQTAQNYYDKTDSRLQKKADQNVQDITTAYESGAFGEVGSAQAMADYNATLKIAGDELARLKGETIDWNAIALDGSRNLANSFGEWITSTDKSFSDFAKNFLVQIAKMIVQAQVLAAIKMGTKAMGFGAPTPSANGNVFSSGSLVPFANGGAVVSQPTFFPMANGGTGLMGEAGIEGVFPLTRINGKLGIQAAGAGNVVNNSTVNQVTVNVQGGNTNAETSQAVTEAVVRALARQEIANSKRTGGLLNPMQISSR